MCVEEESLVMGKRLWQRCGPLALSVGLGAVIAAGAVVFPPGGATVRAEQVTKPVPHKTATLRPATGDLKVAPTTPNYRMLALPDLTVRLNLLPPPPIMRPDPEQQPQMRSQTYMAVVSNVGQAAVPASTDN